MKITQIIEHTSCEKYLVSRNLLTQYKKAKNKLLSGDFLSVDFKKRKPYKSEKYYFRINKKYRAIGYFEGNIFVVFEIDDHQN